MITVTGEIQRDEMLRAVCLFLLTCSSLSANKITGRSEVRKFPDGFLFGTATASYQVEGAWNEDGKSENIWDHLTHTNPSMVLDSSNGDIADDSYHQIERDVEMMRELGTDFYRLSISWTRILPTSFPDQINEAGVQYYNNLINEMLKYNIQPVVTLYHWDLPQKLSEMGGWTNPHIVDWYADYARVAFELFGDRVKTWITINEPHIICYHGYGDVSVAPALNISGVAEYMCAKNLLMAHATAYHIYNNEYRSLYGGEIGITLDMIWYEPESDTAINIEAANDFIAFTWKQYADPIFSETGNFPLRMRERIAAKSAQQGFARSRLPEFTPEEIEFVKGSSDFMGVNHYSTSYVYRNESVYNFFNSPSLYDDVEARIYTLSEFIIGESNIVPVVPWGFYKLLTAIKDDYNNPPVYITENGFATHGGLNDDERITYFRLYLNAMLDAMEEGCDVRLYTAWSIMDNFEWSRGYIEKFGLYEVDFEDPALTRTPRKSAFMFKELIRTRVLDPNYEPSADAVMTIDEGHQNTMIVY